MGFKNKAGGLQSNYNNVNVAELRREGGELKKKKKIKMKKADLVRCLVG